jgi:hypothetical protein
MNTDAIRGYWWSRGGKAENIETLATVAVEQAVQHNQLRADFDKLLAYLGLEMFEGREIRIRRTGE